MSLSFLKYLLNNQSVNILNFNCLSIFKIKITRLETHRHTHRQSYIWIMQRVVPLIGLSLRPIPSLPQAKWSTDVAPPTLDPNRMPTIITDFHHQPPPDVSMSSVCVCVSMCVCVSTHPHDEPASRASQSFSHSASQLCAITDCSASLLPTCLQITYSSN